MEDKDIVDINDDGDLFESVSRLATNSGVYRLWLMVLASAIEVLKNENDDSHHDRGAARSFLFEDPNPFFDFVADELGYSAEALRQRIKKSLNRK